MSNVILESEVTCPVCSNTTAETMPTDACQWYYECEACHKLLKPKNGDCCVLRSREVLYAHRSKQAIPVVTDVAKEVTMAAQAEN